MSVTEEEKRRSGQTQESLVTSVSAPSGFRPPRAIRRSGLWRYWTGAWIGAAAIGIGNAALREALFTDLSDREAHQVSTVTLLAFLTLYMRWLQRRRPLSTTKEALQIGAVWSTLTIGFEFGLGLLVTGDSFTDLLGNYNIAAGRLWAFVPVWMLVGPEVLRRAATRRGEEE